MHQAVRRPAHKLSASTREVRRGYAQLFRNLYAATRGLSADALSKILDGFGAPSESLRIEPERNLLIVRGRSAERQQMIDTALAFDADWMRNQAVGIFPVRSTSPDAIINDLSKVVDPNVVRAQPIERLNAILAVSKSADAMRQASDWITRLDRRSDASGRLPSSIMSTLLSINQLVM